MDKSNLNLLVGKNQSIKIVPSVEDTLRTMGLNVDLDENTQLWLDQLKLTWKTWKKSTAIESHIELFFQTQPDPYRVALVFIIKCEDSKDCKPKSLPYFIMETLGKWSQESKILPEDHLKLPAFRIAIQQRNQHFLNLISKTYHFSSIKETILPFVKDMIKNDNCKQASQIVIAMELFDDIPVEDLLFPLILQDKTNMIDEYLLECSNQVKPLLLFLDNLLDKNFGLRDFVQNYIEKNKICQVKYDKVHHKPLGKLVARLCNKFNIPIETCKNLSKNRTTGGLRYLIHQKYQQHNVSSSVWDDLVKDSLRQNAESAHEFIDMLVDYDRNEALKWASYMNIPEIQLPLALKDVSLNDLSEENHWDTNVNAVQHYYKFSLSDDQVVMIDTGEKFYDLMISNVVKCNIVSIDCEWKPSFGATQSQVALIQIATHNNVYLIDTLILNNSHYASFWFTFYKSLLDNAEIIKLGFGLEQDLKEMKASVTGLGNIKVKGEGYLDLCTLWKNLLSNGLILPGNSDCAGNSLSSLVQSCFGYPLEKSEQCSNWELRPLRKTQIQYAAIDAFVLIQIYDFLQNLCLEQVINFEEICNDVMLERKKKCSRKVKVIDRIQSSLPFQCKSPSDVKFLIEHTISHLSTFLKYCGIDSSVITTTMLWYDVINLAISEDRLILLAKNKCTPSINYPQSSILDVSIGTVTEQLHRIFSYFNICIKQENLLSFCIYCDEKDLKKVNPDEVKKICMEYQAVKNKKYYCGLTNDYEDNDTCYDNFLSDSDSDEDLYQPIPNMNVAVSCQTSKGKPIEINNVDKLSTLQKPAILCESCGKLFWEEDESLKSVYESVFNLTKLSVWQL